MSLQEIQLETNDDIASIFDKLDGLNSSRIIMIRPNGTPGFARRLDMVLVRRHVQAIGTRVALVAKEPAVRIEARMAGLPSYSSVKAARRAKWRVPRVRHLTAFPTRHSIMELNTFHDELAKSKQLTLQPILLRVFFFTIGVVAVLGLAAYILIINQLIL